MNKIIKVAVTGAAGQIAYALLFRLASGAVFGPDVSVQLQLLEIEPALPALEGVAMELQDCAFPLLDSVTLTADANQAFSGVNWAILVGAMPRTAGMERADLLEKNGGIFSQQGAALNGAASDVKVFVVGNPCNTNAMIAMHSATQVPNNRFFAMTMLDENRARAQLAMRAGVAVTQVSHMIIWGNHSATQYPDFHNATINGQLATEVIKDQAWFKDTFIPTVQKRGAAIIKARGASSAASAAHAIVSGVRALYFDTPEGQCYSMACCSEGAYGVDAGLIFSFPCQTRQGVVSVVSGWQHNVDSQAMLELSLEELRAEKEAVLKLALIAC